MDKREDGTPRVFLSLILRSDNDSFVDKVFFLVSGTRVGDGVGVLCTNPPLLNFRAVEDDSVEELNDMLLLGTTTDASGEFLLGGEVLSFDSWLNGAVVLVVPDEDVWSRSFFIAEELVSFDLRLGAIDGPFLIDILFLPDVLLLGRNRDDRFEVGFVEPV